MNLDRYGRTAEEADDDRRHDYAAAMLLARRCADLVGEIHSSGRPIAKVDLQAFAEIFTDLGYHIFQGTVAGLGNDDWEFAEVNRFQDTYSDGTPVLTIVGACERPKTGLPGDFAITLPWCPCSTALPPGASSMGGTPRDCVLLLADPPHTREAEGQPPTPQDEEAESFTHEEVVELFYGNPNEELAKRAFGGDTADPRLGLDEEIEE